MQWDVIAIYTYLPNNKHDPHPPDLYEWLLFSTCATLILQTMYVGTFLPTS